MVPIPSLWLPILLSAVFVFVLSSLLHMLLPYHRSDHARLPDEAAAQGALRALDLAPGDYMLPSPGPQGMKDPTFVERLKQGPIVVMTVIQAGVPNMGPQLVQWFGYCLLVGLFAAYIAGRALGPGAPYLAAFRFAGCTAFVGYTLALWQDSIWYRRKWSTTLKNTLDGLLYALLTGGTFGWLWPT